MPLTASCLKIRRTMRKHYGEKKGDQVFYASENAGKLPCGSGMKKKKKGK